MKTGFIGVLLVLVIGCQDINKSITDPPVQVESGQSSLITTDYGLILSWQESRDDNIQLRMSTFMDGAWSSPKVIAKGDNWFVNWADFPAVAANGEYLFTHFLQTSGENTYDYDVMFTTSSDRGNTWARPQKLHSDTVSAEHGFVSAIPYDDGFYVSWLDGRNTKSENGAMSLRAAYVDINGNLSNDVEVDHKTCDCCQTAMASVQGTPFVVYRDRSDTEVRDIYYAKLIGDEWQLPVDLNNDNWVINGCPVNGPDVASDQDNVAIAWFTGANGAMNVKMIVSHDAGVNYSKPIIVAGPDALGRVDVEMAEGIIYLTYMTNVDNITQIQLSQFDYSGSLISSAILATVKSDQGTGFPRSAIWNKNLVVTWTDVDESCVKLFSMPLNENKLSSNFQARRN